MNNNYSSSNSILMGTNLPAITLSEAIDSLTREAVCAYRKFELCREYKLIYGPEEFVQCEEKIRKVLNIAPSKRVIKTFTTKILAALCACNKKKEIIDSLASNSIKEVAKKYNIHEAIIRFWEKN